MSQYYINALAVAERRHTASLKAGWRSLTSAPGVAIKNIYEVKRMEKKEVYRFNKEEVLALFSEKLGKKASRFRTSPRDGIIIVEIEEGE